MAAKPNTRNNKSKFGVHVLVVIFGITSWSIMNGLWVELPILVAQLPEKWTLPSYLTIISQLGNIGLIVFSLISYCKPQAKLEKPASFIIVTALTLCALMYSLFWKETAYVAGGQYSVALLGLTFSQSVFAATTSIAYVTLMAHLKATYVASIFIGMGISGLIPAFAAIGQGQSTVRCVYGANATAVASNESFGMWILEGNLTSGSGEYNLINGGYGQPLVEENLEPPFSVQAFFLMLFAIGVLSLLSLVLLVYHPYCKTEHVDSDKEENCQLMETQSKQETTNSAANSCRNGSHELTQPNSQSIHYTSVYVDDTTSDKNSVPISVVSSTESFKQIREDNDTTNNTQFQKMETSTNQSPKDCSKDDNTNRENALTDLEVPESKFAGKEKQLSKLESWYLLGLLVWINALQSSFVLAIQVYSSLPYGLRFYHAATKAENIVDPIASFLTFWIVAKTTLVISGLTLLGTLFTAYIIAMATMSPNPALVNETAGGILVVTAWVMCTVFMVFSKVSIAKIMRSQGRLSLMWTGASTQLGAVIGAIVSYVLINCLHLFKDEPLCR